MNNSIVTLGTYQLGATSAYTFLQPTSEDSVPFDPPYTLSSSWRRFIRVSTQQLKTESTTIDVIVSTESTTAEGLIFPDPTPKELLSGPLFQVAGMFAIDEPGWADKHDEYLAETYLENNADSK